MIGDKIFKAAYGRLIPIYETFWIKADRRCVATNWGEVAACISPTSFSEREMLCVHPGGYVEVIKVDDLCVYLRAHLPSGHEKLEEEAPDLLVFAASKREVEELAKIAEYRETELQSTLSYAIQFVHGLGVSQENRW